VCFTRCHRLTGPADFQRVFKRAKRYPSAGFTILIRPNDFSYPRLGLIVSKKCARKAVSRNRIKRQIRESFRLQRRALRNFDIVVMAKPSLNNMNNIEIRALLDNHWSEIGQCVNC